MRLGLTMAEAQVPTLETVVSIPQGSSRVPETARLPLRGRWEGTKDAEDQLDVHMGILMCASPMIRALALIQMCKHQYRFTSFFKLFFFFSLKENPTSVYVFHEPYMLQSFNSKVKKSFSKQEKWV